MKKIIIIFAFIFIIPVFFNSCDEFFNTTGLSEEDIVKGLKTALEIGSDSSCTTLNKEDGYYKSQILKILLPPEADPILESLDVLDGTLLGQTVKQELESQIEDVVLGINRAAEDAAKDAKPIFVDAITNMTVIEGLKILQGTNFKDSTTLDFDSTAATNYLDLKTRIGLTNTFSPVINASLDKDLGLGFSANTAWENLVAYYNAFAHPILYNIDNTELPIPEDITLGEHATLKALDGLFYLVGNEERKIRKDPYQWANDIIQQVFGSVYEE